MKKVFLIMALIVSFNLFALNRNDLYKQAVDEITELTNQKLDSLSIITYNSFQGNEDNQLLKELMTSFSQSSRYHIVVKDDLKELFDYNMQFSEPIYNEKSQLEPGNFIAPKYIISGSANYHDFNRFGKKIKILSVDYKVSDIKNAETLVMLNKEYSYKWHPAVWIIILIVLFLLVLMRYLNQITKGYRSKLIISLTILCILILIVWAYI